MAGKNSVTLMVTTLAEREIVMTRVFDAPRRLVSEASTKPEHPVRWFGPHGWTLPVCEIDFRPGAWRFVLRGSNGANMGMRGVYDPSREVRDAVLRSGMESGLAKPTAVLTSISGQIA